MFRALCARHQEVDSQIINIFLNTYRNLISKDVLTINQLKAQNLILE